MISQETQERIRLFEAAGGVPLASLEYADPLRAAIRSGVASAPRGFRFRCPECGNVAVNNQAMPPACTGPSWRDEHPLEVMVVVED